MSAAPGSRTSQRSATLGWSSRCLAAPRTTRPHDHPPVPPFRLGKVGDPVEVLAHRVRVAGVVNASCIVPPIHPSAGKVSSRKFSIYRAYRLGSDVAWLRGWGGDPSPRNC